MLNSVPEKGGKHQKKSAMGWAYCSTSSRDMLTVSWLVGGMQEELRLMSSGSNFDCDDSSPPPTRLTPLLVVVNKEAAAVVTTAPPPLVVTSVARLKTAARRPTGGLVSSGLEAVLSAAVTAPSPASWLPRRDESASPLRPVSASPGL
jgi:hypothetical protein